MQNPINGTLVAVCLSNKKGIQKEDAGKGLLVAGHGLDGDAHAGGWHRQISLLSVASIDKMRALGLDLDWGDFAENLTVEGIDLPSLPIGTRLQIGSSEGPILQVTQIGKECHHHCAIYQKVGDCVMPREGIFARVLRGGEVKAGDPVSLFDDHRFLVSTITASDKGSKGEREDLSGRVISEMIRQAGGEVVSQAILPDEKDLIKAELIRLADEVQVDLVLTTGGTGLSPRDVTPDATLEAIEREVPGIAEAMRAESLKKTPRAMLSRAVAGTRKSTLIVNLPGSPKAVAECLEAILPALGHGIEIMRQVARECART